MSPEVAGDDFGGAGVWAVGPPGFVSATGMEEAFALGFVRVAEVEQEEGGDGEDPAGGNDDGGQVAGDHASRGRDRFGDAEAGLDTGGEEGGGGEDEGVGVPVDPLDTEAPFEESGAEDGGGEESEAEVGGERVTAEEADEADEADEHEGEDTEDAEGGDEGMGGEGFGEGGFDGIVWGGTLPGDADEDAGEAILKPGEVHGFAHFLEAGGDFRGLDDGGHDEGDAEGAAGEVGDDEAEGGV